MSQHFLADTFFLLVCFLRWIEFNWNFGRRKKNPTNYLANNQTVNWNATALNLVQCLFFPFAFRLHWIYELQIRWTNERVEKKETTTSEACALSKANGNVRSYNKRYVSVCVRHCYWKHKYEQIEWPSIWIAVPHHWTVCDVFFMICGRVCWCRYRIKYQEWHSHAIAFELLCFCCCWKYVTTKCSVWQRQREWNKILTWLTIPYKETNIQFGSSLLNKLFIGHI